MGNLRTGLNFRTSVSNVNNIIMTFPWFPFQSGFIIDEAEVDDEVDEDEEWEDGANEIGIVNEVDEIGPTAREIEIRRRGNLWE